MKPAFRTTQHDDGTYTIHGVPIFQLGNHKGFDYSREWGKKLITNHQQMSDGGYAPSVILGHNKPNQSDEKPAKGRLDNLDLDGDLIKADLSGIQPETFESIKKGEYPHRSVEVNPAKAQISALALLGGTAPYHKLPVLAFMDENPETQRLDFLDLEAAVEQDDKLQKIRRIWYKMMDVVDRLMFDPDNQPDDVEEQVRDIIQQGTDLLNKEAANFMEEDPMNGQQTPTTVDYAQQFAEKHGITPEEAVEQLAEMRRQSAEAAAAARAQAITAFCEQMKAANVQPGIIDERLKPFLESLPADHTVTFDEKEHTGLDGFMALFGDLVERAGKGTLLVDTGEHATHGSAEELRTQFDDRDDVDADELATYKKAKALQAGENIPFDEALRRVMA